MRQSSRVEMGVVSAPVYPGGDGGGQCASLARWRWGWSVRQSSRVGGGQCASLAGWGVVSAPV